ncbi:MAG: LuxR C-terminal-related transcriptional regulator [Actinomycetota bacterium]|nr:LuxR C-terminal-related transcriptional regulator [Actinomycetota bacterium]
MTGAVSAREAEVLMLLGEHLTHAEIAARLVVSIRTVETHVASLRRKLDIPGHRDLVRYAAARRGGVPHVVALSSFVGRARERAELADAVLAARLVSVVGTGGAGKTRLARAVADDVAVRFGGTIWLADLVPVADPAALTAQVAAAVGVADVPGRDAEEALARGIGPGAALLVLDNCEHVANAVAVLVERLVSACPGLHVLITSRARLVLPFERVFVLGGLSLDGDALELFVERAVAAGWDPPTAEQLPRMAAICAALDGLALAVELAAVRLPALGLDGIEAGLGHHAALLVGGARASDRHRSMHDTLDWSYRMLEPFERMVLARVCVFAAGFDAAAAVAVAGYGGLDPAGIPFALGRLADQSLLAPLSGLRDRRWRLLEPVRQFGLAQHVTEDLAAYPAHFAWVRRRLETVRDDSAGPGRDWYTDLDEVADDARAALGWAARQPGRDDEAGDLAYVLATVLFRSGRAREAQQRFEQAAELATHPASVLARLADAAAVAKCQVRGEDAARLEQAAIDVARKHDDPDALARTLGAAAETIVRFAGMFANPPIAAADAMRQEMRDLCSSDPTVQAADLVIEANRAGLDDPRAASAAQRALEVTHQVGDAIRQSAALDLLTAIHVVAGQPVAAARYACRRIDLLNGQPVDPLPGLELKDALHMAALTCIGAGDLEMASGYGRGQRELAFLREQRDLAIEETLAPDALAGRWDSVLADAESFQADWVAAGGGTAPGRAIGPCAVAMVHGLRGEEAERQHWLGVVARLRGVPVEEATLDTGYGAVFDAIVLLGDNRPDAAWTVLTRQESGSLWYRNLLCQWQAALLAEAAVLDGRPDAAHVCARARAAAEGNPVATALTDRAFALANRDPAALSRIVQRFTELNMPYQAGRTATLARAYQPPV